MTLAAFILSLLILTPNHELRKDPALLARVVGYFEASGERYDLPPSLLAYQAKKESSLKHTAIGKIPNRFGVILNERGYCQAHGKARRMCLEAGYDVESREGGAFCIGHLLREGIKECGSLEKGMVWYASGSCRGSVKTRIKMKHRLAEWRRIKSGMTK